MANIVESQLYFIVITCVTRAGIWDNNTLIENV